MARFETTKPTLAEQSDTARPHCMVYLNECGERLLWSARFPIPEIGDPVTITMNGIGAAEVTGYFEEDGYVGVMTFALCPPKWLRDQRAKAQTDLNKPEWMKRGIGCEFGSEIDLPKN